jgi:hypothetical protein
MAQTPAAGIDRVMLEGSLSQFSVTRLADGWSVSGQGSDMLAGVERLLFSDTAYALDIDGMAGGVYRLYRAALGRAPDEGGLGYWIGAGDGGVALAAMAQGFIDSAEFSAAYGTLDNAGFVANAVAGRSAVLASPPRTVTADSARNRSRGSRSDRPTMANAGS